MKNIIKKSLLFVLATVLLCFSVPVSAEDENYTVVKDVKLVLGDNECDLNGEFEYTVYSFAPDEIGTYTVSTDDGFIGIVSYNGMWVTVEPSKYTVSQTELVWDCTSVGQSIWVAINSDTDSAKITVAWDELVIVTIPKTEYANKTTPKAFTFDGDKEELTYVDTFDDIADEAVLGDDGYYHLNAADGPVLYADLNDSLMSLVDANSYGQLVAVKYDDNGEAIEKIYYTSAFTAYEKYMDADGYYPLTEDLIVIYQTVGENNNWYGDDESAWVGGGLSDAWMFACYYVPATIGDNSEPDESLPESDEPSDPDESIGTSEPETSVPSEDPVEPGDASNTVMFVILAVLAISVLSVSLKVRKSR